MIIIVIGRSRKRSFLSVSDFFFICRDHLAKKQNIAPTLFSKFGFWSVDIFILIVNGQKIKFHLSPLDSKQKIIVWNFMKMKAQQIRKQRLMSNRWIHYHVPLYKQGHHGPWLYGSWINNYCTYAISSYHLWCCEFKSCSWKGVSDTTLFCD